MGPRVTPARRHHLVVALIAALAGAGIGLEVARAGVALQPSLAWWLGVIGIIALVGQFVDEATAQHAVMRALDQLVHRKAWKGGNVAAATRYPVASPGTVGKPSSDWRRRDTSHV